MSSSSGNAVLAQPNAYHQSGAEDSYRPSSTMSQHYPGYPSSQRPSYAYRGNTIDPNQQHHSSPLVGPKRYRANSSGPAGPIHHSDGGERGNQYAAPAILQQPNTSAARIDGNGASSSRCSPPADDLGFDMLTIGRSGTPSQNASAAMRTYSGVEKANAAYANQEIYHSAAEVEPENSLRAISDEVDQIASDIHHGQHAPLTDDQGRMISGGTNYDMAAYHAMQHHQQGQYDNPTYAQGQPSSQAWYGPDGQYYDDGSQSQQSGQYAGAGYGSYNQQQYPSQGGGYPGNPQITQYDASGNPYMVAAAGFGLEYPGTPQYVGYQSQGGVGDGVAGMSNTGMGSTLSPMTTLNRQATHISVASANSTGSAAARRRSKDDAVKAVQQKLPFNKAFVEEYRHRMKGDPDAEAQFAYARYLIEAAKKVQDPKDGPKQARKYRDNLLSESLKLIKRLATTGMGLGKPPYSEAQFFLANCFGNGSLGLQVDHEKAYNLYVQASKQNHAAATYRTAVCNEVGAGTRRDHHRAVLFYRKASALGDTAGMYKLGMILLNGLLGQPRNIREAIVWLKRAAGQADEDNPHALHELGLLHEQPSNSTVIPQDEGYARELFTQAAQLGYAPSQFKLGSAYEYGSLTCPVDPRRSIAWYTKAAGKNDGESELALSGWYLTGSEGVLKQSDSEAYLWARRAATKGIPKAEYAVGYYSEVGIGVASDIDEAKRWYMRAAAQGNKRAMMRLTELKQQKGQKAGKKGTRPTRKDAESECVIV
ncbi:hypothetical protein CBS101457_003966 [Exobasidium rhododendri]|nr:hypothetical protein CBS101457_003966 [Exobasidium rhododendri]